MAIYHVFGHLVPNIQLHTINTGSETYIDLLFGVSGLVFSPVIIYIFI